MKIATIFDVETFWGKVRTGFAIELILAGWGLLLWIGGHFFGDVGFFIALFGPCFASFPFLCAVMPYPMIPTPTLLPFPPDAKRGSKAKA